MNPYKVVLLGDTSVGKTSILNAVRNQYVDDNPSTLNPGEFKHTIKVDGREVKISIWDTAGQEAYQSLAPIVARNGKVFLLIFSLIDPPSFQNLGSWYDIAVSSSNNAIFFVVGNKSDIFRDNETFCLQDAVDYADEINATFFQVSAKTGIGINDLFEAIGREIINSNKSITVVDEPINPEPHTGPKKKCCF